MIEAFKVAGPLPAHALTDIIRNAESSMTAGADPKSVMVAAVLDHLAGGYAFEMATVVKDAVEMNSMMGGTEDDLAEALATELAEVKKQIGEESWKTAVKAGATEGDAAMVARLATAAVQTTAPLPMNRGKWLAKLGIVQQHVDSIAAGATRGADPAVVEAASVPGVKMTQDEIDLAAMLEDGPSAPPALRTAAEAALAPPEARDVRGAFVLLREATEIADADLSKRLGVSRGTLHNWLSGRTQKVKCDLPQARVMVAEIEARVVKMRQAADIFSKVMP